VYFLQYVNEKITQKQHPFISIAYFTMA